MAESPPKAFNHKDHIHRKNHNDYVALVQLIDELEQVSFSSRVQAKHYLSNILENVQPLVLPKETN